MVITTSLKYYWLLQDFCKFKVIFWKNWIKKYTFKHSQAVFFIEKENECFILPKMHKGTEALNWEKQRADSILLKKGLFTSLFTPSKKLPEEQSPVIQNGKSGIFAALVTIKNRYQLVTMLFKWNFFLCQKNSPFFDKKKEFHFKSIVPCWYWFFIITRATKMPLLPFWMTGDCPSGSFFGGVNKLVNKPFFKSMDCSGRILRLLLLPLLLCSAWHQSKQTFQI